VYIPSSLKLAEDSEYAINILSNSLAGGPTGYGPSRYTISPYNSSLYPLI